MKWFFLFLILPVFAKANCPASRESCSFYRCMEKERPCGPHGYWMGFGDRYCRAFLNHQDSFSEESQRWLTDVRECLQVRVHEVANDVQCRDIYSTAMNSHVSCYVDTGFCNLAFRDRLKIYWWLRMSLTNAKTWQEAFLINKACRHQL